MGMGMVYLRRATKETAHASFMAFVAPFKVTHFFPRMVVPFYVPKILENVSPQKKRITSDKQDVRDMFFCDTPKSFTRTTYVGIHSTNFPYLQKAATKKTSCRSPFSIRVPYFFVVITWVGFIHPKTCQSVSYFRGSWDQNGCDWTRSVSGQCPKRHALQNIYVGNWPLNYFILNIY